MKIKSLVLLVALAVITLVSASGAAGENGIQADLETQVGGTWGVCTNDTWTFIAPTVLPAGLTNGTYVLFISEPDSPAMEQATRWMQTSQAPFFILGMNPACVALTYVPRTHPVSQAILKALRLEEPKEKSATETRMRRDSE